MLDELRKIGLAGIGAAAVAVEKTGEAIDMLAKHGEKTLENTKAAREEFAKNINAYFSKTEPAVNEVLDKLEQLSKEGLEAIKNKIEELELDLDDEQSAWDSEEDEASGADDDFQNFKRDDTCDCDSGCDYDKHSDTDDIKPE